MSLKNTIKTAGLVTASLALATISFAGVKVTNSDISNNKYIFRTNFEKLGKTVTSATGGILSQTESSPNLVHITGLTESWVSLRKGETSGELVLKFDFKESGRVPTEFMFESAMGVYGGSGSVKNYYSIDGMKTWIHISASDQTSFAGWPALNTGAVSLGTVKSPDIIYYKAVFEKDETANYRWCLEGGEGGTGANSNSISLTKGHGFAIEFKLK